MNSNRYSLIPLRRAATVLASNVDKKSVEDQDPVRLVNYVDVYYGDEVSPALDLMIATATPEQITKFRLRTGDTIITKDSETAEDIGVPAFVAGEAPDVLCGYHLAMIRAGMLVEPRFLYYAMRSKFVRGQLTARANGVTRFGLTYDAIKSVAIPYPSRREQRSIVGFLDAQLSVIRSLVPAKAGVGASASGALDRMALLLQEFEEALVSACVVGDYRVAEAAAVSEVPT